MDIQLYKFHTPVEGNPYQLDYLGVIDDFISCTFTRSFAGLGNWSMVLANSNKKIPLLKEAQFIKLEDGCCGLINQSQTVINDEVDGDTTIFSGTELKGLAYMRVVDTRAWAAGTTNIRKPVGSLQGELLDLNVINPPDGQDNRIIPGILYEHSLVPIAVYYPSYKNLGECLEQLGSSYDSGWTANIEYGEVEIVQSSKQLINPNKLTFGSWIDEDGYVMTGLDTQHALTELIPVTEGQTYYFYGPFVYYPDILCGYDNQGNPLPDLLYEELEGYEFEGQDEFEIVVTIPSGVTQVRLGYVTPNRQQVDYKAMFEIAPKTEYAPYGGTETVECNRIVWYTGLEGRDRTSESNDGRASKVVLGYHLDNLQTSELNNIKYTPNVAYVAGQGQGTERVVEVLNDNNAGMNRYELTVDARDIADANDLPSRGEQYLSNYGTKVSYVCEATENIKTKFSPELRQWSVIEDTSSGSSSGSASGASGGIIIPELPPVSDELDLGDFITIKDDIANITIDTELLEITKVFDESGRERTQLSFGEFKGTLSDNIASMDNSINDLARNNQGLPVDQDGQTYIASPLLIKQTEQAYIKFEPLDTVTHTNTYTATIGANPTTPSLPDDEYFYIKINGVYFRFFPSNQIHIGSTHWDDIILTRDNAKALRNSTDLDYTGTVRWCTTPNGPPSYFPKGTWRQIGSIAVGNKTVYAYEKTD